MKMNEFSVNYTISLKKIYYNNINAKNREMSRVISCILEFARSLDTVSNSFICLN